MSAQPESNAFFAVPDAYDNFMGRFAKPLAQQFVTSIPLAKGDAVLDLGCGPGALTAELVNAVGAENVSVVDPSPPFLEACKQRYPGITGKVGRAEELPFDTHAFDAVMSQLVIHFIPDLDQAGKEMMRVTRPGGWVAACTWTIEDMELIHSMDEAARRAGTPTLPAPRVQEFSGDGSVAAYLDSMGLEDVTETTLTVRSGYTNFDELWNSYLAGIGPMAPWMQAQSEESRTAIKAELFKVVGEPGGAFELSAKARSAHGRTPT